MPLNHAGPPRASAPPYLTRIMNNEHTELNYEIQERSLFQRTIVQLKHNKSTFIAAGTSERHHKTRTAINEWGTRCFRLRVPRDDEVRSHIRAPSALATESGKLAGQPDPTLHSVKYELHTSL